MTGVDVAHALAVGLVLPQLVGFVALALVDRIAR